MKKIGLALAGVLLLVALWQARVLFTGEPFEPPSSQDAPSAVGEDPRDGPGESLIERRESIPVQPETAPEEALPEPYGSLLVQVVWEGEESVASDVAIVFHAEAETSHDLDPVRVVTDAKGVARVDRIRAGKVILSSDRGGELETVVEAGRELRFALPRGVFVAGEVVDETGGAVPGAGIWLTTHEEGWLGGRVVARSAGDGSFRVRGVDPRQSLGALASGHAPSDLVDLETLDTSAETVRVHLVASQCGAVVEGRVLRLGGHPVEGALVAVGAWREPINMVESVREQWTPIVLQSDAEGRFRCDSVAPGAVPIAVRAAGFAPWEETRTLAAGERAFVEVVLDAGVTVRGTVRAEDGELAAGARVMALEKPFDERVLEWMGPTPSRNAFGRPSVLSDERGEYTLHRVRSGEIFLFAIIGRGSHRRDQYGGRDEATLRATPGEELRWDARLSRGLLIRGRIQTADGKAPGFLTLLKAAPELSGARPKQSSWDLEGCFQFAHCADVPYTIIVPRGSREPVRVSGVRPGGEEVLITLPAEVKLERASVVGRVVDDAGRLPHPGALAVHLQYHERGSFRIGETLEENRFRFTDIEPGRYRALVFSGEVCLEASEWFDLAPGERRDLGEIHTHTGGALTVRPVWKEGASPARPRASLRGSIMTRSMHWDGRAFRAEGITPGKQSLRVYGPGIYAAPREVEILVGQNIELEVEIVPAARVPLEVHPPLGGEWKEIHYRARNSAGEICFEGRLRNGVGLVLPCRITTHLPVGSYTLEAEADGGKRWSQPLTIAASGAQIERIAVDLR